jgi:hypothetical protein
VRRGNDDGEDGDEDTGLRGRLGDEKKGTRGLDETDADALLLL